MTGKFLTGSLIIVLILACEPTVPGPPANPTPFDWLYGQWQRQTANSSTTETWQKLNKENLQGKSVRVNKASGDTTFTESLMLCKMENKWYYFAKVAENRFPVPFELITISDGRFVFENPTHDFPQWIVYQQQSDSTMTVTVDAPNDATSKPIVFKFRRLLIDTR